MILLAYGGAVVIAILATTAPPRWVRAGGPRRVALVRILAGAVAAVYAAVVGVAASAGDGESAVASAIAAIAATGAVSYGAGLLRWSGPVAWLLRLGGWTLMICAAVIPSHLTLLLPLVAALAVTLHPSGGSPEGPQRGGKPRGPRNRRRRVTPGGSASRR